MLSLKSTVICACLMPFALFANNLSSLNAPHWQTDFSGYLLTNAGTNAYGARINNGENTQLLAAQHKQTFSYQFTTRYIQQKNTWSLSYAHYSPAWKTNSTSNPNFNGSFYYSGKDSIQEVDFQHGYLYFINQQLSINLHAGFSYISEKSTAVFNGRYSGAGSQFNQGESQFSGTGPNVGLTLIRQMGQHFSFSNTANIGLFYGSFNATTNSVNNTGTVTAINTDPKHNLLVPSVNVNFAFGYHYQFSQQKIFHTELGVQFKQLFNATKTHNATSGNYDSVAFYGPFLRVGYLF